MSAEQPSNTLSETCPKSGNCSFFHSCAKNPPEEKISSTDCSKISNKALKAIFREYLLDPMVRIEVLSANVDVYHASLLIVDKNVEFVVNASLVVAVIERYVATKSLILKQDRLMRILWIVYTELSFLRNRIVADDFFQKEMETFVDVQMRRRFLVEKWGKMLAAFQPLENSHILRRKKSKPIVTGDAPTNMNYLVFELKNPRKWYRLGGKYSMNIYNPPESYSNSEEEPSYVKAIEGGSISRDRSTVEATVKSLMRPLTIPKLSDLLQAPLTEPVQALLKEPGEKYPRLDVHDDSLV
ncbi:hypothetical protein TNCV_1107111 [Trichonephila clavipes]|nr:hypothetical protein TNCV_1107111 [Trichonephila clavipes]